MPAFCYSLLALISRAIRPHPFGAESAYSWFNSLGRTRRTPKIKISFASSAPDWLLDRNEHCMKKAKSSRAKEQRAEYTRADFPGGLVRGKYAARIAASSNIVRLDPEIADAFPTS